jgi:hypothetical protein
MSNIEQLLAPFPQNSRQLRFSFDHNKHGYAVCAFLTLPSVSLIARTDSPTPDCRDAIDKVIDHLAAEIRSHADFIGKDLSGDQRNQLDAARAAPHLESLFSSRDRDGFLDVLRPLLRQLAPQTSPIAIDRVAGAIWQRWGDRAPDRRLDEWLPEVAGIGELPPVDQ